MEKEKGSKPDGKTVWMGRMVSIRGDRRTPSPSPGLLTDTRVYSWLLIQLWESVCLGAMGKGWISHVLGG